MGTSYNTAYTLRAVALALRDITPFGRNVVYAGSVIQDYKMLEVLKEDSFIGNKSDNISKFGG